MRFCGPDPPTTYSYPITSAHGLCHDEAPRVKSHDPELLSEGESGVGGLSSRSSSGCDYSKDQDLNGFSTKDSLVGPH